MYEPIGGSAPDIAGVQGRGCTSTLATRFFIGCHMYWLRHVVLVESRTLVMLHPSCPGDSHAIVPLFQPVPEVFQGCASLFQCCKPSNVATCNVLHCVGTSRTALEQVALNGPQRAGTHTQAGGLEMEAHALGSAGGAILSVKRYPYSLNTYPDAVTQIT